MNSVRIYCHKITPISQKITHAFPYSVTRTDDAYCKQQHGCALFQASDVFYLKSALFCDVTRRIVVIPYWCFGKTYRSNLRGSRDLRPIYSPETPVMNLGCVISHNGRDSSGGIATGYGLDGPGIEIRWGKIFHTRPDRPWGPPSLLYNGYRVFPGVRRPGRGADHTPPYSAEVKRV
jgi:hypothetical protein